MTKGDSKKRPWTVPPCRGTGQVVATESRRSGFTSLEGHKYRDRGICSVCGGDVSIVRGDKAGRHSYSQPGAWDYIDYMTPRSGNPGVIATVTVKRTAREEDSALIEERKAHAMPEYPYPYDYAILLSPWVRHHSDCARTTHAGDYSCGLQEKLLFLRELSEAQKAGG